MTNSRLILIASRTTVLGALLAGFATLAVAQKPKPPVGPPVITQGTVKSNPKADKGQAMAEAQRAEARDDKAVRAADKARNQAQRTALKAARNEPKALLKGIDFAPGERQSLKAIEKRYADELKQLRKLTREAEQEGRTDLLLTVKIDELRLRERAELRRALTPAQQARFDRNVRELGTRKY